MSVFWSSRQATADTEIRSEWPLYTLGGISALFSTAAESEPDLNVAATSLQSVAIHATVDLIASLSSELPFDVYSGTGADRVPRTMPAYLRDPAGDGTGLEDWSYCALTSWLLRGNLYGDIIEMSPSGLMTQVDLHYPDDVHGTVDENGTVQWTVNGRPVTNNARFLHRRVNPVPGRVLGLSPIAMHAEQIGLSLSTTRFGRRWFVDGAHPGGMLTNTLAALKPEAAKDAKDRFLAALRGTREPVVLGKGWDYKQIQVAPEESQFLETQGFTEAQCARIFGPGYAEVLGYDSGGSLTYATLEGRSAHLLVFSLNKWLRRLERLLSSMLPRPQYVRINRDALLQATTLDRYRAHELALRNRWKVVNEVRAVEELAPVEWGDEPNEQGAASSDTADATKGE
jgi:HK97 family phage portal protein